MASSTRRRSSSVSRVPRVRKASESHEFADRDLHLDGVRLGENREASGERAGVPAFDRASVEEHVAVLGGEKACGDAEHGGLARAVGADERRDLSLPGISSETSSTTGSRRRAW